MVDHFIASEFWSLEDNLSIIALDLRIANDHIRIVETDIFDNRCPPLVSCLDLSFPFRRPSVNVVLALKLQIE